ncbi:proteasome stabiliser-domain-containing protein [Globomyces pollinis-pini]|nr:proteasome stabiliser-domain-containing protein [Globomyces pollinis-pini]
MSDNSKDLALLDTVELKLGLAESDNAFQALTLSLLAPLLRKLSSSDVTVRSRIMSICSHVNTRYNANTKLELPTSDLVTLFSTATSPVVKSVSLVYLQMAFNRLSDSMSMQFLPQILPGFASLNVTTQTSIFAIALPILAKYSESIASEMEADPFKFTEHPNDLKLLLQKISLVLLYTVPSAGRPLNALNAADALPQASPLDVLPAGLSQADVKYITNNLKATWTYNNTLLRELKTNIVKFTTIDRIISKESFSHEKFMIYLIASVDVSHQVQFVGEDGQRRFAKPNYEDLSFILQLYRLYQGIPIPNGGVANVVTCSPASVPLRIKIIDTLLKSVTAASQFPQMIQVVFDALYGADTKPKLRASGMAFVQWIAKMAKTEVLTPVASVLFSGLLKVIDEDEDNGNETLRGFAYESIGLLGNRVPTLVSSDTELLTRFFKALSIETRNVRVAVQESLCQMLPSFINSSTETLDKIRQLILQHIDQHDHHARYVSIKYVTTLFPFSDPFARYICLIACSDIKLEVKEIAMAGLVFPKPVDGQLGIPSLSSMIECIQKYATREWNRHKVPGVTYIDNMSVVTVIHLLAFLRSLIVKTFDPAADLTAMAVVSEAKLDLLDTSTTRLVQQGLKYLTFNQTLNDSGITGYIQWIETSLNAVPSDGVLLSKAAFCLLELLTFSPAIAQLLESKTNWIKEFLNSPKSETRSSMAHILGIVATADMHKKSESFNALVDSLISAANDLSKTAISYRHGSVMALGYIVGRTMYRYPTMYNQMIDPAKIQIILQAISSMIDSDQTYMSIAGCLSYAELGRYGTLSTSQNMNEIHAKIQTKLQAYIKSSKDLKLQESALFALSHHSLGNDSNLQSILDFYLTLPNILSKQPEFNFNIGEAFASSLFGFSASCMDQYLDIPGVDLVVSKTGIRTASLHETYMEKVMALAVPTQNAVTKKAICVWLLCLTKYCGKAEVVKKQLFRIHSAFSSMLGDRDEFTQEIASKGIGMVYDIGDQELKNELVRSLVSTFTDGKKIAPQSVTGTTELFDSAVLGNTPDGSNLGTYQSILSLAADMNQPDLVYKFMSLASHHAIWNSRRGASMGFSSIAAQAEKELEPFLPSIVPKLYRYQFDPHPKTAAGMKNIWNSLVKDSAKTVESLFKEIITEVLKSLGDRSWRTRESSCSALSDLLHGRQIEQLEPYMKDLWTMCFRTLDDIKESVRKAAFLTAKTLTNMTVRYCDPSVYAVSKSQKIMDEMIPFLLFKGLPNTAEEVRAFSLSAILKLCKTGGVLLKPHVTDLIYTLLESLSSLEPQSMNYLSFHADSYNLTQEQLDTSRLSAAKTSPIMDAIDQCVQNVDEEVLVTLVPKLVILIRKGVGLPTRAGTARFVYSLVQRVPLEMRVHADEVLKALSSAIYDRSAVIRKSFSTALGYITKLSSFKAIEKTANSIKTKYLDATDEEGRSIAPVTFLEMSRHAPQAVVDIHAIILPLAFMGARDVTFPNLAEIWKQVWEENTGGSNLSVQKWKVELLDSCVDVLTTSPSWSMKRQVGKALVDIGKALGNGIVDIMPKCLNLLFDALAGRTWEGKEAVLEALATIAIEGKDFLVQHPDQMRAVEDMMIKEAKKNNKSYRRLSIEYLGQVFSKLESDRFDDVKEYLFQVAENREAQDDMDIDEDRIKPMLLAIQANAFKSIGQCFPFIKNQQELHSNSTLEFLSNNLANQVWNIRISVLEAIQLICEKISTTGVLASDATVQTVISGVTICLQDGKYRNVRDQATQTLKLFLRNVYIHPCY